jgi:uncharacterized protein (DUF433 family)
MSKTKETYPKIGEGIFLIKDVSDITGEPYQRVRRWLLEFWDNRFGKSFGEYSYGDSKNKAINFNTLIEFIVFAKLRKEGISAQKIQKHHTALSKELKTPFPFAKSKIQTDGKDVWHEIENELSKLDGKRQLSFKKILAPFLKNIEFDENQIAKRYFPLGKKHKVVVDPNHQFGQPTILGTNIKTDVIYSLYKSKESKKNICELYNLQLKQVNDAISYYKRSKKIAA